MGSNPGKKVFTVRNAFYKFVMLALAEVLEIWKDEIVFKVK